MITSLVQTTHSSNNNTSTCSSMSMIEESSLQADEINIMQQVMTSTNSPPSHKELALWDLTLHQEIPTYPFRHFWATVYIASRQMMQVMSIQHQLGTNAIRTQFAHLVHCINKFPSTYLCLVMPPALINTDDTGNCNAPLTSIHQLNYVRALYHI